MCAKAKRKDETVSAHVVRKRGTDGVSSSSTDERRTCIGVRIYKMQTERVSIQAKHVEVSA